MSLLNGAPLIFISIIIESDESHICFSKSISIETARPLTSEELIGTVESKRKATSQCLHMNGPSVSTKSSSPLLDVIDNT